jgi:hypothetical protein
MNPPRIKHIIFAQAIELAANYNYYTKNTGKYANVFWLLKNFISRLTSENNGGILILK